MLICRLYSTVSNSTNTPPTTPASTSIPPTSLRPPAGSGMSISPKTSGKYYSRSQLGRGIALARSKPPPLFLSNTHHSLEGIGGANGKWNSLALAEIRLTLAHILWHFDMQLDEETDEDWATQKGWLTWAKKPLVVKLKARKV